MEATRQPSQYSVELNGVCIKQTSNRWTLKSETLSALSFLMLSETIVVPADAVVGRRLSEQEKKCTHFIYISVHRRREAHCC